MGVGAPQRGKGFHLIAQAAAETRAVSRIPAEMAEKHRPRAEGKKQTRRPDHRVGIELVWRRIGQHIVVRDVDEAPSEFIPGEETAGTGVQDHMLVPRVARSIEEAQAMPAAEIQFPLALWDEETRLRHRFGEPEVRLQFIAEYRAGPGYQPAGVHEMFGAAAVHDDARRR